MVEVRSTSNVVYQCASPVAWRPTYRRPVSEDAVDARLTQIKGWSSRPLREKFPSLTRRLPTLWTNPSQVATAGGAPWEITKHYVENQHNKQTPFPPHG